MVERSRSTKANNSHDSKRTIDEETKKAMAQGRERSRIVDLYLKALEDNKWRGRGSPRRLNPQQLESKIAKLENEKSQASGNAKLFLIQEQNNLKDELNAFKGTGEYKRLEAKFIAIAKQFSLDRKISYDTWREMGVPVRTLIQAGMYPPRGSRILNEPDDEVEKETLKEVSE